MWFRWTHFGSQWFWKTENRREANEVTRFKRKEIEQLALDLHAQMYTAFADARITDIEGICLEGLAESMRQRMSRRRRTDVLKWDQGTTAAKLVSMKQIQGMIKYKGQIVYVQQAVVRIEGSQTLKKGIKLPGNFTDEEIAQEKNVQWKNEMLKPSKEYLVLQRRILALQPTEWQIWGFTQETTMDNWEKIALKNQDPAALAKSKSKKDGSDWTVSQDNGSRGSRGGVADALG